MCRERISNSFSRFINSSNNIHALYCSNKHCLRFYFRFAVEQSDHFKTSISEELKLITNFYVKKISMKEFKEIEQASLDSEDWGLEVCYLEFSYNFICYLNTV